MSRLEIDHRVGLTVMARDVPSRFFSGQSRAELENFELELVRASLHLCEPSRAEPKSHKFRAKLELITNVS